MYLGQIFVKNDRTVRGNPEFVITPIIDNLFNLKQKNIQKNS